MHIRINVSEHKINEKKKPNFETHKYFHGFGARKELHVEYNMLVNWFCFSFLLGFNKLLYIYNNKHNIQTEIDSYFLVELNTKIILLLSQTTHILFVRSTISNPHVGKHNVAHVPMEFYRYVAYLYLCNAFRCNVSLSFD